MGVSLKSRKLIKKLCLEWGLSEWHRSAAVLLAEQNGIDNALDFLKKCAGRAIGDPPRFDDQTPPEP